MTDDREHATRLLGDLRAVRTQFGAGAGRRKAALLAEATEMPLGDARILRAYHDTLLFFAAYPDGPRVRALAERELARAGEAARHLAGKRGARALDDSGITGTTVESSYTLALVEWITGRFPEAADIAWDDESAGGALDDFLSSCVARVETDGLLAGGLTTQAWFDLARGDGQTALAWLIERIRRRGYPPDAGDRLFEALDLQVRLTLPDAASTTFVRFPARPVFHHPRALKRQVTLRRLIAPPVPAPCPLPRATARRVIEAARAALLVRHRETDPVTQADEREVTLFPLDRGVDVATIGMTPARRLPIESFFGYVAAKNGLPVAYGGGWVFLDRAEIGINVFDAYRGGESAYLFGQILRVYHHHYRVRRFVIDPFQIGADNEDGIKSGAFWFYYRLGFRPTDPALRRLADEEHDANRAERGRRTRPATLRRFATGTLALDLGPGPGEPNLIHVGLAVTAAIGRRFGGDRDQATRWAARHLARVLGAGPGPRWSQDERAAFDRLAVLFALIPDLAGWSAPDRRALAAVLRAKGGPRERDYVCRMQDHPRLRDGLAKVARIGAALAGA